MKLLPLALIPAIIAILIIKSCTADIEAKTPYIAFNMLLQNQIMVNNKNERYLGFLENTYGVNRKQMKQVYGFLSRHESMEEVRQKVNEEISKSIKECKKVRRKKEDFFIANVLAPYLALMVNQFYIDRDDSQEIQTLFSEIFGGNNILNDLENGTLSYNSGGYLDLNYLLDLNLLLQAKGFYLNYSLSNKFSNIYKISKAINIQWKNSQNFDIYLLKRMYPNILPPGIGYSGVFADNVLVIEDFFPLFARRYIAEIKKRQIDLQNRDFVGLSLKQIERALIIQTAIHEAKHKVDEYEAPNQRLNIDNEISAHLTEAIFSPCPYNALHSAIERLRSFQRVIDATALNSTLHKLRMLEQTVSNKNYEAG